MGEKKHEIQRFVDDFPIQKQNDVPLQWLFIGGWNGQKVHEMRMIAPWKST
jgi:hypothetical protein